MTEDRLILGKCGASDAVPGILRDPNISLFFVFVSLFGGISYLLSLDSEIILLFFCIWKSGYKPNIR